jgi:hypothetical protein
MKKWLLQTSTIGGLLGIAITGIQLIQSGATALAVASGTISALLLLVNDGAFLKGLVPMLFLGLMATSMSCGGSLKGFADEHQDEIDSMKRCAIDCGTDITVDALSCPMTGGSLKDIINAEVAKGLAQTAGVCVLQCLAGAAIDVATDVCKE